MILADTSAWVEYLRATESEVDGRLTALRAQPGALSTTDAVMMEVLTGARSDGHRDELRRMLSGVRYVPTTGPADFEDAAEIHRACRFGGRTLRSMVDCLIAAVALREGLSVLHRDRDFDVIAEVTGLIVETPSQA